MFIQYRHNPTVCLALLSTRLNDVIHSVYLEWLGSVRLVQVHCF